MSVAPSPERTALLADAALTADRALRAGDAAGAVAIADGLIELAPDDPMAWATRSRVLRAVGRIDEADTAEANAIARVAAALRTSDLQQRMNQFSRVTFLGGPPEQFVELGQMQLLTLLEEGLESHHTVLDVGCGALRAGLWLAKVLEPGHYFGIEPNRARLGFGVEHVMGAELVARRQPRFDTNDRFDFSVFGVRFDFVVARSVWTHAAKPHIEAMLDGLVQHGEILLASYLPARTAMEDYRGDRWVGQSDSSPFGGLVRHDRAWMETAAAARGLTVRALERHVVNDQVWLRIERAR